MADHEQPSALEQVRQVLKPGRVYRRADLLAVSNSVDRHLQALVQAGDLRKLAQGLYYASRKSVFGELPPDDAELVRSFLRDDDFLLFSPSAYNTVGLVTANVKLTPWRQFKFDPPGPIWRLLSRHYADPGVHRGDSCPVPTGAQR